MKRIMFLLALLCLEKTLHAQTPHTPYIYTIKADSVKITNTCDTAELIIENHTQTVPGFLFNKGRGRTEFRKPLIKVDDSIYVIGVDTLRLSNVWLQGGNRYGTTGIFGTLDNNHIDFYTNNTKRGRWTNTGNLLIGTETDNDYKLAVGGPTYSTYFTNSQTPLGGAQGDGAVRLRWGGPSGTYIEFYNQGNTNRRGFISSPADYRPLVISDSIGVCFTSVVAVGIEGSFNAKLNVATYKNSTVDGLNVTVVEGISDYHTALAVKVSGNTVLGGTTDNGARLQVYGTGFFSDTLTATTMGSGDNSNRVATTAFVKNAIGAPALSVSSPGATDVTATTGTLIRLPDLSGASSHSVILPAASAYTGQRIYLWNMNSSSNAWTFSSSVTLPDGTTSNTVPNQSAIELLSDGAVWIKWK